MKRIRTIITAILLTSLVFGISACGNSNDKAETSEAVTSDAAEVKETEEAGETEETGKTEAGTDGEKEYTGTVVVYSPHDADPLNAGVSEFMKAYPGIQVEIVAAGTGELLNRIKAESANPQADVLWGGGADSLAAFKEYFAPYVSANDDVIAEEYKDADDLWIGESPLPMVIFYNKELLEKDGVEVPTGWEDLLDPKLKGKIAYCLPSKSGSAYTQLVTMILGHGGKEEGWNFISDLYENLDGKMVDSSGKCHKMVKDGEFSVGLTLEKSAVQYANDDTVGYVYPKDGTSAVPDGVALVKGAPNEENAKIFIDYVTGYDCQLKQNQDWGRRPVRNDIVLEDMIALDELVLVDYDFDWAASEKENIIERFNDIMVGE